MCITACSTAAQNMKDTRAAPRAVQEEELDLKERDCGDTRALGASEGFCGPMHLPRGTSPLQDVSVEEC